MVVRIGHDDAAVGGDGDAGGLIEQRAGCRAVRPEAKGQSVVGTVDLDAAIAVICHDDAAVGGDGDAGRGSEQRPVLRTKWVIGKSAVRVEELDAVVATVGHDDAAVGGDGDAGGGS